MPSYPLTVPGAITNIALAIALPGTGPFDFATQIANKPTTLAGYGIVDALRAADAATTYATLAQFLTATGSDPNFAATIANSLSLKAPLASPSLTGIPLSTTAAVDTNTFQIATTAFVIAQGYLKSTAAASTYAPLASPSLTGIPLSTTAAVDTNTFQIATTAFVIAQAYLKTATAASTYATIASPSLTGLATLAAGTATTAVSPLTITQTWNGSGIVFPGIVFNATDTLSAAGTLFLDLQISGSSKLSFQKTGKIVGNGANPYLYLDNAAGSQLGYGTGILNNGGNSLTWAVGGTEVARVDNAGLFSVASGGGYQWSSTSASSGSKDIILLRDAAGILAQRNGTTAQALRVYNTYTDASNYERAGITWSANTLEIGSESGGTGSARTVVFGSNPHGVPTGLCIIQGLGFRIYCDTSGNFYTFSNNRLAWTGTDGAIDLGGLPSSRFGNGYFKTSLQVTGATSKLEIWNTDYATSAVNYEKGVFDWTTTGNTLTIGTQSAGTGVARTLALVSAATLNITSTSASINITSGSSINITPATNTNVQIYGNSSSWVFQANGLNFYPASDLAGNVGTSTNRINNLCARFISANAAADTITVKNSSASGWSDIIIQDSAGTVKGGWGWGNASAASQASTLFFQAMSVDFVFLGGSGSTEVFRMNTGGGVTLPKTITASGTTGARTINQQAGSVNFAAAATSLIVTNSLVTVNSVVTCQLATNDTTAVLGAVVKAAGSFTIYMKTAPTAETRVDFVVATV